MCHHRLLANLACEVTMRLPSRQPDVGWIWRGVQSCCVHTTEEVCCHCHPMQAADHQMTISVRILPIYARPIWRCSFLGNVGHGAWCCGRGYPCWGRSCSRRWRRYGRHGLLTSLRPCSSSYPRSGGLQSECPLQKGSRHATTAHL